MQRRWILASDVDNTLTGDREALDQLAARVSLLREQEELFLILSTGRRLDQVLAGIEEEGIPYPDGVISQVGTEIYLPPYAEGMSPLAQWETGLLQQFSAKTAVAFLEEIRGLEMQPQKYNTSLKVSCYLDGAPDPDSAAALIKQRINQADKGDAYQVVWSSGRDLDIIPAAAGKGNAIQYIIQVLDLEAGKVIVAGDSGNDRSMFDKFNHGIIVANAQPELKRLQEESVSPNHYFAQNKFAAGVTEGLRHFGVLTEGEGYH
jgi:sucrose-6F-phosphate phosphohydrolase